MRGPRPPGFWMRTILAANAGVFLLSFWAPGWVLDHLALSAGGVFHHGRAWELLTHAFTHLDFHHFLLNLLALFFFGFDAEDYLGPRRFPLFYAAAAGAGGVLQAALNGTQGEWGVPILGASGAVMGILLLLTIRNPRQTVYVGLAFFLFIPVPIWLLSLLYIGTDVIGLQREIATGLPAGIAFGAHLGGAAVGAAVGLKERLAGRRGFPGTSGPFRAAGPVHGCETCRRTERDGRHLDFRVCAACGREYCHDHLAGHPCGAA